jgi:rSAM/selenodomain-associated transferase 1
MTAAGVVAITIMAKAPTAGEVKTRLCPPLSPDEAALLARCFLLDTIGLVRGLGDAIAVGIAFTPESDRDVFEALAPGVRLVAQRGDDMGARMLHALEDSLRAGHAGALVIGSDTPTLPPAFLRRAVERVVSPDVDLVLGPSDDGGYYLIGMRTAWPFLFTEMPWSTAGVAAETVRRAGAHGLRVARLPSWLDVDTPEDLRRLVASFAGAGARPAPHTRRFLDGWTWGAGPLRRRGGCEGR